MIVDSTNAIVAQAACKDSDVCELKLVCVALPGGELATRTIGVPTGNVSPIASIGNAVAVIFGRDRAPGERFYELNNTKYWLVFVNANTCTVDLEYFGLPAKHRPVAGIAISQDAHVVLAARDSPDVYLLFSTMVLQGGGELAGKTVDIHPTPQSTESAHRYNTDWRLLRAQSHLYAIGPDLIIPIPSNRKHDEGVWMSIFTLDLQRTSAGRLPSLHGHMLEAEMIDREDILVGWLDRSRRQTSESTEEIGRYDAELRLVWKAPFATTIFWARRAKLISSYDARTIVVGHDTMSDHRSQLWLVDPAGTLVPKFQISNMVGGTFFGTRSSAGTFVGWIAEDALELRRLDDWGNVAEPDMPSCPLDCPAGGPCEIGDCVSGTCRLLSRREATACPNGTCVADTCQQ